MNTRFPELGLDLSFQPVAAAAPRRFTPEQIEHFNREGYIANVPLYQGEALAAMRDFFTREKARITPPDGDFQSYHHTVGGLYDVVTQPLLVAYLQDLLGNDVVCHVTQYVCKEPGQGVPQGTLPVVWHQDASFNPMDARSVVVWLGVDDAFIENGCMWFIPGSHRRGGLDIVGPNHEVPAAETYGEAIPIPARAGEAVFFSDLLLHSSRPNISTQRRGAFTMSFTNTSVQPHGAWNQASVICAGGDRHGYWKDGVASRPGD